MSLQLENNKTLKRLASGAELAISLQHFILCVIFKSVGIGYADMLDNVRFGLCCDYRKSERWLLVTIRPTI